MALADNTSAIGWVYKSQFNSTDDPLFKAKSLVARHLAAEVTKSGNCLATQHLKGENNIVADYLSFAGSHRQVKHHPLAYDDPDDHTLTQRFHSALPQLIPRSFAILPLPDDVFSFALRVLQIAESSLMREQNRHMRAKIASGDAGPTTAMRSSLVITPSSITYPSQKSSSSYDASWSYTGKPSGTEKDALLECVRHQWSSRLSKVPPGLWARRFGQISNQAPCTSPAKTKSSPQSATS